MARNIIFKKIRREIAFHLISFSIHFFRCIPRRIGLVIASILGRIAPFFAMKEYRLALRHLTMAFGEEKSENEIRKIARDVFRNLVMNFADTVRVGALTPEEIEALYNPNKLDEVWRSIDNSHGVVIITAHLGSWEALGAYLCQHGVPLSVVARKLYDSRLEILLYESRVSTGMEVITRGDNTRDIIKSLTSGKAVALLVDQDINVKGEYVTFFGRPAHTATSPALLALKYGSAVMLCVDYRDKSHKHNIIVKPIEFERTNDKQKDVTALMQQISNELEQVIREHPEQWVWFHKRWRTQPEAS